MNTRQPEMPNVQLTKLEHLVLEVQDTIDKLGDFAEDLVQMGDLNAAQRALERCWDLQRATWLASPGCQGNRPQRIKDGLEKIQALITKKAKKR